MKGDKKEQVPIITAQPTKMRIKLYDKGLLISDRLVEQSTEFNSGPKATHTGPMSLELNLDNQEEVEFAIAYLKKLKGDLPIVVEAKKSAAKKIDKMLSEKEPLLDLLKTLKVKALSQERLIEMLREYKFRFLTSEYIRDYHEAKGLAENPMLVIRDMDMEYQFMARLVRETKSPFNDQYDFRLTFGIKIIGERVEKVRVYLWGKYDETLKIPWEKVKGVNFKKVDQLHSFPEWMDYADRRKWRVEHRKWEVATEKGKFPEKFELSKGYLKAAPYVKAH